MNIGKKLVILKAALLCAAFFLAHAQTVVIPGGATYVSPSDDLAQIVSQGELGAVYALEPGIHRLSRNLALEGETLIGMYGAVISGSDVAELQREGDYYIIDDATQEGVRWYTRDGWRICGIDDLDCAAPEWVFANGQPLVRVSRLGDVVLGTFFWDYDADKIYLSKEQTPSLYEITVTREQTGALITATDSELINLNIKEVGNDLNTQVVRLLGNSSLRDSTLAYIGGVGVTLSGTGVVDGNTFIGCGRICFVGVSADGSMVSNNKFYYSNYKGTNPNFEGGDTKTVRSVGLSYIGNESWYADGYSLWYDGHTSESVVSANSIFYASKAAIINEITGSATITGNYIEGSGIGVYVSSSRDTVVSDNLLKGNVSALQATDYCRTLSGEPTPLDNVTFVDNTVTQTSHIGPSSEWPKGKASIVNISSFCDYWNETAQEWFDANHVAFIDNEYTLEGQGDFFMYGFRPRTPNEWLELGNQ